MNSFHMEWMIVALLTGYFTLKSLIWFRREYQNEGMITWYAWFLLVFACIQGIVFAYSLSNIF